MYSIQENDHQTKPQIYKKKKRFHGKTNLNITKFLVHKVGGAKWPDSRRNSAAYRPLMTTLGQSGLLCYRCILESFSWDTTCMPLLFYPQGHHFLLKNQSGSIRWTSLSCLEQFQKIVHRPCLAFEKKHA